MRLFNAKTHKIALHSRYGNLSWLASELLLKRPKDLYEYLPPVVAKVNMGFSTPRTGVLTMLIADKPSLSSRLLAYSTSYVLKYEHTASLLIYLIHFDKERSNHLEKLKHTLQYL